jgi:hypothetical protein
MTHGESAVILVVARLRKAALMLAAALCLSLVLVGQSRADSTVLNLTQCNTVGLCNAGSISLATSGSGANEVIVATVTTTGTFTFTELGFNGTNLSGVTSISNSSYTYSPGSKNLDGFGSFAFVIEGPASSSALNTLTFSITCTGGCTTVGQVSGFAIHIIAPGVTGFDATSGVPAPTPEPASMMLFGSGLLAIAGMVRRRKTSVAIA